MLVIDASPEESKEMQGLPENSTDVISSSSKEVKISFHAGVVDTLPF